ncbi:MAG: DNA polymerase, partial [Usitatibacter sp.]
MLRSLLVDFNSYFASCEQQAEPRLRGKPLGIVPILADTTVCIAASIEAKTFGVKTGTKVAEARRLCPQIEFVVARHELYIDYHHRAVALVDTFVPVRKVLSIDEMDCELTGRWREPERALDIARRVKSGLSSRIGECLRTSIGIGPNTFIAKTASDLMKPDGLVMIQKSELPDRLFKLGVRELSGIGKQMEKRLAAHGIHTVRDLCGRSKDERRALWGGIGGEIMHDRLRGEEQHEAEADTHSISHSSVLGPERRNPEHAFAVMNRLVQKAAMR